MSPDYTSHEAPPTANMEDVDMHADTDTDIDLDSASQEHKDTDDMADFLPCAESPDF